MNISIELKDNDFFNVSFSGLTIYGCKRKQGTGAKGDYDFIAMPQRKGNNDKWYAICKADDKLADAIMDAYLAAIGAEGKGQGGNDSADMPDDDSQIPF